MKELQTTPLGLWRYAKDFSKAASIVVDTFGDEVSTLPAYYLCGHSIELSLKAYLLGEGIPLRKLKSKEFGHNLERLVGEALRHNLKKIVHLSAREIGEIQYLNINYVAKDFEYHGTKSYDLPLGYRMKKLADKLVLLLEKHCENLEKQSN